MRRYIIVASIVLSFLMVSGKSYAGDYKPAPHPRLLLKAGEEQRIKDALAASDEASLLRQMDDYIIAVSERAMNEAPVVRIKTGKRLLAVSRQALKRIFYLSYAYRTTDDERYAKRAVEEMLAASRFSDWNPSHFLDVGEMTMALAIGYDWLYDYLTPEQKAEIRGAILTKGFESAQNPKDAWFYTSPINWNQVCNAGLAFGALAVYEDETEAADSIISRSLKTIPLPLEHAYSKEGGYAEGYMYWGYGSSFQIMYIAALESALGTDFGLSELSPGFLESRNFMKMMSTPMGNTFNFSDSEDRADVQYMQFWMADKTGDTSVLWPELQLAAMGNGVRYGEERLLPMGMIFGSKFDMGKVPAAEEKFYECTGTTPLFIYRSGWKSLDDTYLGIKGGSSHTSHSHVDVGEFILESDAVRWAMDLGKQDYYSLESQGVDLWNMKQDSQRWDVFRYSPWVHNIIKVDDHRPAIDSSTTFCRSWKKTSRHGAQIDLTPLYGADLKSYKRSVWLDRKENLTVSESIVNGPAKHKLTWTMCTEAQAKVIDNQTIELSANGKVRLLGINEKSAKAHIWSTVPPNTYDAPNPGTVLVGFELPLEPEARLDFKVRLMR